MRICYCGIRFFFEHVLQRNWHILGILRAQTERRIPAVLSREEVRSILAQVHTSQNYAYLSTVYSCGLRLHEGLHLEVSDIDSSRMMIHVHRGKGAKDRYVPIPLSTLTLLRRYWLTHRHPSLLFPALGRNGNGAKDALSPMAKSSVQGRIDFYLPVKALSVIFKAKFRDAMKETGLFDQIPSEAWQIDWNVNSQAVGPSEASLKYLAPYVFRVALSNARIVKVQGRTVFIHYRKSHSHRLRTLALEVMEFIRRFLQHVLPTGFMKVRYYGFMNPNCGVSLDRISTLIELSYGFQVALPNTDVQPWQPITCPTCGGTLRLRSFLLPSRVLLWSG